MEEPTVRNALTVATRLTVMDRSPEVVEKALMNKP
jgi:hypothetical protein